MHSRAGVHCQDCHTGNPESFNMFQAHRGVLNSRHPSSSTHTRQIPATCGRCHGPIYDAFRRHEHFTLLQLGDARAPSCTTCHGSAASRPLTPRPVGCNQCHNTEADAMAAPLGSRGPQLLRKMQDVAVVRHKVEARIARLRDAARKHDAEGAFFQADVAWQTAIEAGHGFAWDEWEALIQQSSAELEALLANLRKD